MKSKQNTFAEFERLADLKLDAEDSMSTEKRLLRCFACDRPLGPTGPYAVVRVCQETTMVYVGRECLTRIRTAGPAGYQPPLGGPRLCSK
jgi:hypothetical protein